MNRFALHSHVSAGHVLQLARGEMHLTYATGAELRLWDRGICDGRRAAGFCAAAFARWCPRRAGDSRIETPTVKSLIWALSSASPSTTLASPEVNVFQGISRHGAPDSGRSSANVRLTKGEAVSME